MPQVRNMKHPNIDKRARMRQIHKKLVVLARKWRAAHDYLSRLDYEYKELKKEYEKLQRETFVPKEKEEKKEKGKRKPSGIPKAVWEVLNVKE